MIMLGSGVGVLSLIILLAMFTPFLHARYLTWESRIENFRHDAKGSYQVQQAKIAIAKGRLVGVGPGNSEQQNFLPSPYSDFIYAIIVEEYGLLGGVAVILLYLFFPLLPLFLRLESQAISVLTPYSSHHDI